MLGAATRGVPLLPPIDQWGYEPFPLQPLTPHSLSRRTRDLLAGDLGAHRDLPVDPDQETAVPESRPVDVPRGGAYGRADWEAAVRRRRDNQQKLTRISALEVDVNLLPDRHPA